MKIEKLIPILNVSSVPASLAWFEKLGWTRTFTWNQGGGIDCAADRNAHGDADFAGACSGAVELFLCQGGQGSRGTIMPKFPGDDMTDGVWMAWKLDSLDDLAEMHALALRHGFIVTLPPKDRPWGLREFHLRHPDGHMFRVGAGLEEEEE
jgi:hypothetical protein